MAKITWAIETCTLKSYAEIKIYGEYKSICETIKKKKEIHAGFAVASQVAKVIAIVHDKFLAKMEKSLNLWAEDMKTYFTDIYTENTYK